MRAEEEVFHRFIFHTLEVRNHSIVSYFDPFLFFLEIFEDDYFVRMRLVTLSFFKKKKQSLA